VKAHGQALRPRRSFCSASAEKLKLELAKPLWNPNSTKSETGADVAVALAGGRQVGIQVTEVDPFPQPGTRGRERAQVHASASGVVGNYAQNNTCAALDAICRAIERKTRITPAQSQFNEVWLLLCLGVPDAPTSTFVPTSPLSLPDLNEKTTGRLLESSYAKCFILPIVGIEKALYKWSREGAVGWKKFVHLEEIAIGTGDVEYVRELLRTHGKDKSVVDAQVKRVLAEIRAASSASGTAG
jgi:hypothetical protein